MKFSSKIGGAFCHTIIRDFLIKAFFLYGLPPLYVYAQNTILSLQTFYFVTPNCHSNCHSKPQNCPFLPLFSPSRSSVKPLAKIPFF